MNILFSYILQFSIMITPLICLPIISRMVTVEEFSTYILLQSICLWISYIIDYGFMITSSKLMAKDEKSVSDIIYSKAFLSIVSFFIAFFAIFLLNVDIKLVILSSVYTVLLGLNFQWYFLAKENLKFKSYLELISSLITVLSLVLLSIYNPVSICGVIVVFIISRLVNIILSIMCLKKDNVSFIFRIVKIKYALKFSFDAFILKSGATLYTVANGYIISFVLGVQGAAIYLQAERLIKAAFSALIPPLTNALYPKIIDNKISTSRLELSVITISLLLSSSMYILNDRLLNFFYYEYDPELVSIFNLFLIMLPVISTTNVFMFTRVYKNNIEPIMSRLLVSIGLVNVVSLPIAVKLFGLTGAVINSIVLEFLILSFLVLKEKMVVNKND
ncbi:oligosaccharide flippase family protein [Vibrio fluvialis]|nr:oligosaccharide flippase family protein [Vibrio fluvialis]